MQPSTAAHLARLTVAVPEKKRQEVLLQALGSLYEKSQVNRDIIDTALKVGAIDTKTILAQLDLTKQS